MLTHIYGDMEGISERLSSVEIVNKMPNCGLFRMAVSRLNSYMVGPCAKRNSSSEEGESCMKFYNLAPLLPYSVG